MHAMKRILHWLMLAILAFCMGAGCAIALATAVSALDAALSYLIGR